MPQYQISYSPRLSGEIHVSTAKNAVLPILAAALLTQEEIMLHRVPQLTDVRHMLDILRSCGAEVLEEKEDVRVRCVSVGSPRESALLRTMRASVLILGPLAARNGECSLSMPGGCAIGQRPIDIHLKGLKALGAEVSQEGNVAAARGSPAITPASARASMSTYT